LSTGPALRHNAPPSPKTGSSQVLASGAVPPSAGDLSCLHPSRHFMAERRHLSALQTLPVNFPSHCVGVATERLDPVMLAQDRRRERAAGRGASALEQCRRSKLRDHCDFSLGTPSLPKSRQADGAGCSSKTRGGSNAVARSAFPAMWRCLALFFVVLAVPV